MSEIPIRRLFPVLLAGSVLAGAPAPAAAQDPSPEELAELRARVARAAEPGPEHARLTALEGAWRWETVFRPAPGAEPATATGVATARPILDGRFLVLEARRREGEAAPRASRTILGFDRRSEEYTVLALDTWGTYWVTARGSWDGARDAAVMSGRDRDPLLGHVQLYDFVLSFPEPDAFRIEIVFHDEAHAGDEGGHTMVRTTYRRRSP